MVSARVTLVRAHERDRVRAVRGDTVHQSRGGSKSGNVDADQARAAAASRVHAAMTPSSTFAPTASQINSTRAIGSGRAGGSSRRRAR